jgi:hypothetical protein
MLHAQPGKTGETPFEWKMFQPAVSQVDRMYGEKPPVHLRQKSVAEQAVQTEVPIVPGKTTPLLKSVALTSRRKFEVCSLAHKACT